MIDELAKKQLDIKLRENRAMRYAMQSVAKKVLPDERVSFCLRHINAGSNVSVWKHIKTEKAFYDGLMVCGSVWNCPVCAAKISEKRRKELKAIFQAHKKEGGKVAMLTLTFSHKKMDKLGVILESFSKANTKFMSGRAYHEIREEMGIIGRVRAMEVTYGKNGFHPHAHIALFYMNEVDLEQIKKRMFELWQKACNKFGLVVKKDHALDLQSAEDADSYLSKQGTWSLDQELTKAHIKQAKNDSMTPFDFLRAYLKEEDRKYLRLFKEYAECFKGKRQLQWSQGFKKRFDIEDKSDEELATEKTEMADLLGLLDYDTWREIVRQDNRSYFLDLCERQSFEKAVVIIGEFAESHRKSQASLAESLTQINN